MSALLAILLFAIFGYEYEFPLFLNVIIVPIVIILGYLFALGLHVSFGLEMFVAMSIESVLLLASVVGFHLITS